MLAKGFWDMAEKSEGVELEGGGGMVFPELLVEPLMEVLELEMEVLELAVTIFYLFPTVPIFSYDSSFLMTRSRSRNTMTPSIHDSLVHYDSLPLV